LSLLIAALCSLFCASRARNRAFAPAVGLLGAALSSPFRLSPPPALLGRKRRDGQRGDYYQTGKDSS
jgi:hypothetical protein